MYYYITPLQQNRPKNIILHVDTNNGIKDNSDQIVAKIKKIKRLYNKSDPAEDGSYFLHF